MGGLLRCLERGVGGEGVAVLDNINCLRYSVECCDGNIVGREQLGQLDSFFSIARADDELGVEPWRVGVGSVRRSADAFSVTGEGRSAEDGKVILGRVLMDG
jgi:hypothetical protein